MRLTPDGILTTLLELVQLFSLQIKLTITRFSVSKAIRTSPPSLQPVLSRRNHTTFPLAVAVNAALTRSIGLDARNLNNNAREYVVLLRGEERAMCCCSGLTFRGCPSKGSLSREILYGCKVSTREVGGEVDGGKSVGESLGDGGRKVRRHSSVIQGLLMESIRGWVMKRIVCLTV